MFIIGAAIFYFTPKPAPAGIEVPQEQVEENIPSDVFQLIGKEKKDYWHINKRVSSFPSVSAISYLIADLDSGFIFAENNSKERLSIASLTKLMAGLVAVENIGLEKSILIEEEMLKAYGSIERLEDGREIRAIDLIYLALIESSNNAAEVLSRFLGREEMIGIMNQRAKEILMENTRFVDPHGFGLENISTTKDLFNLTVYIFNREPSIFEITRGNKVSGFPETGLEIEELWNKNVFSVDPNFLGGKTGYLKEPKNSAVFIFKFIGRDEQIHNIAIILLCSDDTKVDTQRIYRWLMDNYSLSPVFGVL